MGRPRITPEQRATRAAEALAWAEERAESMGWSAVAIRDPGTPWRARLARELGVTRSSLTDVLAGRRPLPARWRRA